MIRPRMIEKGFESLYMITYILNHSNHTVHRNSEAFLTKGSQSVYTNKTELLNTAFHFAYKDYTLEYRINGGGVRIIGGWVGNGSI